jgi:glucose/arabinose dehydrogenase
MKKPVIIISTLTHPSRLGLAFFPKAWPREFRYDLLVAYHASWNRTVPTGYKVVRFKLEAHGNPEDLCPKKE